MNSKVLFRFLFLNLAVVAFCPSPGSAGACSRDNVDSPNPPRVPPVMRRKIRSLRKVSGTSSMPARISVSTVMAATRAPWTRLLLTKD